MITVATKLLRLYTTIKIVSPGNGFVPVTYSLSYKIRILLLYDAILLTTFSAGYNAVHFYNGWRK